jgi:hypothetical protein
LREEWLWKEKSIKFGTPHLPRTNNVLPGIGFDESQSLLYYGSPVGIKIVNVNNGQLVRVIGKVENTERFLQISLY